MPPIGTFPTIELKPTRPETCYKNVAVTIEKYRLTPKENTEQILQAIARLIQDLEQLHVFVDGNSRTLGIDLLNRELLLHNLSPSVLRDVNQLDCLSTEELVEAIKEGQHYFQSLFHRSH